MLGKLLSYNVEENKIKVAFEKGEGYITVIKSGIINFFVPLLREEKLSKAVENIVEEKCEFNTTLKDEVLTVSTEEINVKIYSDFKVDVYDKAGSLLCEDYRGKREPFVRRAGDFKLAEDEGHELAKDLKDKVYVAKTMEEDMFFYGMGERTGSLNKRGYHYRNWNTDNPNPHGETFEQLYKSIPFLINFRENKSFGLFFDNTFESSFDLGKENPNYYSFASVDGNLDYYFIYGPSVKEVIKGYTHITGTTPLPQLWTLGYQQCRWSYAPEARVRELAKNFREKDIPCDTLFLDIDYMDGYRVFTWDKNKFENPEKMLKELKEQGFKVVTIIDPGVKKDAGYKIYDEGIKKGYFATDKDNLVYVNKVWPGDAVYPNFLSTEVRKWWAENQKIMTDTGVSGIWNDMNEPASFNGPLPDDVMFNEDGLKVEHREIHNVYGQLMSKATYNGLKAATGKRPYVITRACYAGIQKYSTCWTGDNQSTWEHLRMSLPMLMNLGLSGVAFCGTDVGGFGFDCTGELLSRWVQVGAFTPLFRNHSSMGTRDQEPWAFDETTEAVNRKYIKLRYKLLPYFYDLMREAEKSGLPVIRPLFLHYENDSNTYEVNDEFLCGENILVAPVIEQGRKCRVVYLPKGDKWIDYWTGEEFEGGQNIIRETPIDLCPIYIKAGAVLPYYPEQHYVGEKQIDTLELQVFLSKSTETSSRYISYEDDGESFNYRDGVYNEYEINVEKKEVTNINLVKTHNGYTPAYKDIKFTVNNVEPTEVTVNGEGCAFEKVGNGIAFKITAKDDINIVIR